MFYLLLSADSLAKRANPKLKSNDEDEEAANRGRLSSADQNMVWSFAAVCGIGWITSRCSTTLPFFDR
jgi:hypothetical protein